MAHELAERSNGTGKAMMYAGDETPWHGFGKRLSEPPTAREAIVEAGLDYHVASVPMFADLERVESVYDRVTLMQAAESRDPLPSDDRYRIAVPTQYLNVRIDNLEPLGIVSDRYKVVQNSESFEFLDSLVASGELRYETAGALGRGERVWMLARMPGDILLPGDDRTQRYLLLSNSHDGGTALRILPTAVRVVCANTLSMALSGRDQCGFTFRHVGAIEDKLNEARKALGFAERYFDQYGSLAQQLAARVLTDAQRDAYFNALYPDPASGDPAKQKQVRAALWGLLERGKGADLESARGTAWGLVNSVTEYVDHHVPISERDGVSSVQRRWESSVWGDGQKVKSRAFNLALATIGQGTAADRALVAVN
jgi:phage/plasmid-like protein (TIGR03299 family)